MPRIQIGTDEKFATSGNFGYSGAKLDHLAAVGGAEFTLVTILSDVSHSVSPFKVEMETCLRATIEELQKWAGRAGKENAVMLRWVTFSGTVNEEHGFRLLSECEPADYRLNIGSVTACFEAATKSLWATGDYAKQLAEADWLVNALTIVITDGDEYPGDTSYPLSGVGDALTAMRNKHEALESHVGILVGVNTAGNDSVKSYLAQFEAKAGWDHMRTIEEANADGLSDLTALIVSSVSSQSQGIGSGGASVIF